MDALLTYVLNNFSKLATLPGDIWLSVFVLQVIIVIVIWRIIHKMYSLSNAVNASAITTYKDLTDSISDDRERLKQQNDELKALHYQDKLKSEFAKRTNLQLLQNAQNLNFALLHFARLQTLQAFLTNVISLLVIYKEVEAEKLPDAPQAIEFSDQLDSISQVTQKALNVIDKVVVTNPHDITKKIIIPQELVTFNAGKIEKELNAIYTQIDLYLAGVFEK